MVSEARKVAKILVADIVGGRPPNGGNRCMVPSAAARVARGSCTGWWALSERSPRFRWRHKREFEVGRMSRISQHVDDGSGRKNRCFEIVRVGEGDSDAHATPRHKTVGSRQQGKRQFYGLHRGDRHQIAREVRVPWQTERLEGGVTEPCGVTLAASLP